MFDTNQYYPTPIELSVAAWRKFKNKNFVRVLEPSAGKGHLLEGMPNLGYRTIPVDCIELDISKHDTLRKKGFDVVGVDFMEFKSGSMYSHIIQNSPFHCGVKHLLKAWDILYDGEIVSIVNAETIKNPYSKERQHLVNLIEKYGEVEFMDGMFDTDNSERKTAVEIGLVWLKKQSKFDEEIIDGIINDLKTDKSDGDDLAGNFKHTNDLMLPNSFIENSVLMFNAALEAAKESVKIEARARRYCQMMGKTMGQLNGGLNETSKDSSVEWVKSEIFTRYLELKDKGWTGILRSTKVTSKLSSKAQQRLESEFENIKKLEFTEENIYGFLQGIIEKQGEIQIDMCMDVFDLISRYHTDNAVYYMGQSWKSNDKHRTLGMSIKKTRFVIPGHKTEHYHSNLSWSSLQILKDIDTVFAMLDGKQAPEISMESVFERDFKSLRNESVRGKSSYFEFRYHPGVGTLHFFPRKKELINRLNILVGRHRQWLPPSDNQGSKAFWEQFENAEKMQKDFNGEIKNLTRSTFNPSRYRKDPFWEALHGDDHEKVRANNLLISAMTASLEKNGISIDDVLTNERNKQGLLECA